jgi:hypothetical protein
MSRRESEDLLVRQRDSVQPGPISVRISPRWSAGRFGTLAIAVIVGLLIRVILAPAPGLAGDLDQFVLWVHGIAVNGWGNAYDQNLSFPAVMGWIWGALAFVQPAFATVSDAADPAIRALMKVPACLADVGLAAGVAWWFRGRPKLAIAATVAALLWPATWYISAWWGQYEPIYVLPVLVALLAARARRPGLAAALLAIGLMTKPQALPLAVPFAAWFLATGGWRGAVRVAAIAATVAALAWLPFVAAGGPMNYLRNLSGYQDTIFSVLSLRAWNPWWLLQEVGAGGGFVADRTAILGPVTFRLVGLAAAGVVALVVFVGVYRRPTAANLAMGLAAIALGAFITLTTMHERYAYPALVFLLLAWPRREAVVAWAAFAVAFALDLLYSVPPPGLVLPGLDIVSVAGSLVITAVAMAAIRWTWRGVVGQDDETDRAADTGAPLMPALPLSPPGQALGGLHGAVDENAASARPGSDRRRSTEQAAPRSAARSAGCRTARHSSS